MSRRANSASDGIYGERRRVMQGAQHNQTSK